MDSTDDEMEHVAQQQLQFKSKVVSYDTEDWQKLKKIATGDEADDLNSCRYVAGLDISYLKSEPETACVAIVVCQFPHLDIVYKDCEIVQCTSKYVAGFLAAREAPFLIQAYSKLKNNCPQYLPQVVLIDGNGVLHPNECGIACIIGIELDVPTIGVAKNLYCVDGIEKDEEHKKMIKTLTAKGDSFPLTGHSGRTLGLALRTGDLAVNPVYVSVGHKISLETAAWVVAASSKHRVPEPIRQADSISTEFLKKTFPDKE